jgi:ABC-2 type transport system ATP-binding protein
MTDTVIEARGLRKHFGPNLAVADLSISVRRGEVFGFLGPNGAGKTTTIKMLLGLVAPTSGSAMLLGAPLGDHKARAKVGFLPEHFRFHDSLTARELLRIHGRLYGLRGPALERRIDAWLERVNLREAANRPLQQFSKGMTQRAGLAQALIAEPELVFLDEPTSGFDPLGRLLVRRLIEEVRARGASVFLNSHLLGEVEATCDRVAFVKRGRTVHEMSLRDAAHTLEVELRIDHTDLATLEGLRQFGTDIRLDADIVHLRAKAEGLVPEIARWLVAQGIGIHGIGSRSRSLEDYFVEIMGDDERPG